MDYGFLECLNCNTCDLYFSYHKQASADAEAVWRRVLQLLRQLGRQSDSISEKDVKLFCKHARDIYVERGSCVADEYDSKILDTNVIGKNNFFPSEGCEPIWNCMKKSRNYVYVEKQKLLKYNSRKSVKLCITKNSINTELLIYYCILSKETQILQFLSFCIINS